MAGSGKKNEDGYSDDNEQQHQHKLRRRNISSGFFHGYPYHHLDHHRHAHVQASCNVDVHAESSNDDQFPSDRIRLNPEEGLPIGLTLRKSMSLIKQLQMTLTQQKQQNNRQEALSQRPPARKLKASNFPAVILKIGSWVWTSKNEGDLIVKFYYGKKKLVWEFLYGCRKRKIEILWSHVSAINAFVDEDKTGRLEIEMDEPPKYYKEIKFQPQKHTQWTTTGDFTGGQAHSCRRHTLIFSPGVLESPFKKLLQYDNRLFKLSRQPFPTHECLDFTDNSNVYGCSSIPLSIYEHQGTVPSLLQQISSFVEHSGCNLPMSGLNIQHLGEIATKVAKMQQRTSVFLEQSGNNQIQDICLPTGREEDHYLRYQGLAESWTPDRQLESGMDIKNFAEFTNQQNCFKVYSNCKPFIEIDENNYNPSGNWMNDGNHHEARLDISSSSGSVMNHSIYHDDEICSFNEQQVNDVLAFLKDY
ncbi:hypothetical protein L2E82_24625 [Cichorium intybus]|uniref:Uncharacterized protein n=1 Tax=Cichorium intybus TaxID=13427 RepID=A0ACB9E2D3_CICIN|nr:hypothetical protein L2E82_24625 [Cichorium intybus]